MNIASQPQHPTYMSVDELTWYYAGRTAYTLGCAPEAYIAHLQAKGWGALTRAARLAFDKGYRDAAGE